MYKVRISTIAGNGNTDLTAAERSASGSSSSAPPITSIRFALFVELSTDTPAAPMTTELSPRAALLAAADDLRACRFDSFVADTVSSREVILFNKFNFA